MSNPGDSEKLGSGLHWCGKKDGELSRPVSREAALPLRSIYLGVFGSCLSRYLSLESRALGCHNGVMIERKLKVELAPYHELVDLDH